MYFQSYFGFKCFLLCLDSSPMHELVYPATKRPRMVEKKDDEFIGRAHPSGSSSGDKHSAESTHDVILTDVLETVMDGLTQIMGDYCQPTASRQRTEESIATPTVDLS